MKTRLAALATAAALGALAGAGGCVDNRASIQLQAICAPPATCTFTEKCDAQYIGYPALDKGASPNDTLWLTLQVANQLPNNQNLDTGRLNTNNAHVDEVAIEFEGGLTGTQTTGSNYEIPAEGTSVISTQLDLAAAAAGEVLARIRARGYLDDGTRFETGEFPVTVIVCASGCAPAACGGGRTCPPDSEGQLPLACVQ